VLQLDWRLIKFQALARKSGREPRVPRALPWPQETFAKRQLSSRIANGPSPLTLHSSARARHVY
jgi:hypothetical protein